MTGATIETIAFINAGRRRASLDFYRDKLGFSVVFQETEPQHQTPIFAIVSRDGAMLFLKGRRGAAESEALVMGGGGKRTSGAPIRDSARREAWVSA